MPSPGNRWRHVIINTHSTWLHGDPRGFRDRGHRTHSSGDYRRPPPRGEHDGLHRYRIGRSSPEIHLARDLRPLLGRSLVAYFLAAEYRVLAVAVTKVHAHLLVEIPDNIQKVRAIIGQAKRLSSRAVKQTIPGSVWAAGGTYKPMGSRNHQRSVHGYILYDQGPGAWTWSFQDGSEEGQFLRRPRFASTPPRRGKA
jgi:REP element-mobilizing transposase RayT